MCLQQGTELPANSSEQPSASSHLSPHSHADECVFISANTVFVASGGMPTAMPPLNHPTELSALLVPSSDSICKVSVTCADAAATSRVSYDSQASLLVARTQQVMQQPGIRHQKPLCGGWWVQATAHTACLVPST